MTRPGPGKFEANESLEVAELLYGIVNESGADEFFGSVDENGWFGIIRNVHLDDTPATELHHYIVMEDHNGFFTYHDYPSLDEVNAAWSWVGHDPGYV